jgi:hypothetical protein
MGSVSTYPLPVLQRERTASAYPTELRIREGAVKLHSDGRVSTEANAHKNKFPSEPDAPEPTCVRLELEPVRFRCSWYVDALNVLRIWKRFDLDGFPV